MIIGIDYSTYKIDLVGVRNGNVAFAKEHVIRKNKKEKFNSSHMAAAASYLMEFIAEYESHHNGEDQFATFLELPFAHVSHRNSMMPMSMMAGAISAGISLQVGSERADEVVFRVPPSKWKREVVGKGNATKDEVREWTQGYLHSKTYDSLVSNVKTGSDQDLIDAFCIGLYGERAING